ncbi:MAG: response regulator [Gammaproteobacteria bacterium]|nr:response regulator [Gammaproteobacteria bacterium]
MNKPDNEQVMATTWHLSGIFEFCQQRNISINLIVKNTTLNPVFVDEEAELSWSDYTQVIVNLHHLLPDQEFDEACGLRWRLPENIFWKDLALILDDPQDLLVELIGERGDLFYGLPIQSKIKENRSGRVKFSLTWTSGQAPTVSYLRLLRAEISSFASLLGLQNIQVSTNQAISWTDVEILYHHKTSLLQRLQQPVKRLMSTHRLLQSTQVLRRRARDHRAEQYRLKALVHKQHLDHSLTRQQLQRYNALVMRDCWYISSQGEFMISKNSSMNQLQISLEACNYSLSPLLVKTSQPLFSQFIEQITVRPDQVKSVNLTLNWTASGLLSITLIYLGTDSEIHAQGIIIDTSEQSRLQLKHDKLVALGQSLSQLNPIAMVILNQSNRIVWSSDTFHDLAKTNPTELLDQDLISLIPETLADRELRHLYYSPEVIGQARGIKAKMIMKDNSLREIKISGSSLGHPHSGSKLLLIEDHNTAKNALIESRKLHLELDKSRKMATIGNLLSSVVHDLSNFLVAINGYAALAVEERSPGSKDYADGILYAGQQANALTQKLLTYNKPQPQQTTVQDLRQILENSKPILQQVITPDIKLTASSPEEPLYADVAEDQIQNILLNLIINARDALLDGGEIKLEASPAFFTPEFCRTETWARPGRFCEISVTDNGSGIAEEILAHVFEPYFSTKTDDQGSGLGLANIRNILEASKGFINLSSKPLIGTSVKIFLPQCGVPAKRVSAKVQKRDISNQETLLLIEPDQRVSRYAQLVLRAVGYTVLTAYAGDEGLTLYKQHQGDIDLLLTELVLPTLPGQKLIDQVQVVNPTQKILICSAHLHFPKHASFISEKHLPTLSKPYQLEELRHAVAMTLISAEMKALSKGL